MKKGISYLFSFFGFALILILTSHYNLGATSDSINYIEIARNLKAGNGFVNNTGIFVNHWPPLYQLVLATTSIIANLDPLEVGKYLQAILLGLSILVFNKIVDLKNVRSFPRIFLNCLLLFSVPLNVFVWFLSEGLFIFLLFSCYYFILKWQLFQKNKLLIIAGFLAGLLMVTRYAGLGFVGGILIYLFFFQKKYLKDKVVNCVIFTLSFLPFLVAWFSYSLYKSNDLAHRSFTFHPITFRNLLGFNKTILNWIVPFEKDLYIIISGFILLGILIFFFSRISNLKGKLGEVIRENRGLIKVISVSIVSYIIFLFFSRSFLDAQTPMDNRILSPIYFLALLFFIPFANQIFKIKGFNINILIPFIIVFGMMLTSTFTWWHITHKEGDGFTSKQWKTSETLKYVTNFSEKKIYTNASNFIALYFPEKSNQLQSIPKWMNPGTNKLNKTIDYEMLQMKNSIEKEESVLIYSDCPFSVITL